MTAERDLSDVEEAQPDEGEQRALRGYAARAARTQILRVLLNRGVLDSFAGIEEPGAFVFVINGEEMRLRNVEVETFVRGVLVGLRSHLGTSSGDTLLRVLEQFAPHDTFSRGLRHGLISESDYTIGWKYEQEVLGFLGRLASV